MFGYVKTDFPNLYMKDHLLYKAMYCGLCKGIGKTCGQKGRFLLSYDLTFLSVFIHNICNVDVEINKERCVLHQVIKRPIAKVDEITKQIACLNVILAYNKLKDDVLDSGKGKIKKSIFTSSYKRAKKLQPQLDEVVSKWYNKLLEYEKLNIDSIDMSADPFGQMIADVTKILCKDLFNDEIYTIAYNLGKWIYLIDALDDFDKDKNKGSFNVFCNCFNTCKTKEELLLNNTKELISIFSQVLLEIENSAKNINYNFNHDLIDNILVLGLKQQTKNIYRIHNKR